MTTSGSCLCSGVQYTFKNPQATALCHCTDCQKWCGSAYSANVVVGEADYKVTGGAGQVKEYVAIGDSGKQNRHFFCSNCGSCLYTKLDVMPGSIVVKSPQFETPAVEFYAKDRVGFLQAHKGADQKSAFT